ncbi:MAG TPA: hypothetical protein DEB39_00255 [Planctomycetaceae bacterium]|nr:hypothetical protein [Planctomycetaceae bacterium]
MKIRLLSLAAALFAAVTFVAATDAQERKTDKKAKILHFTRSSSEGHGPARMQEDGTTISGSALKTFCNDHGIELVESHDGRIFDGDVSEFDAFVFYTTGGLQDENTKIPTMRPMSEDGIKKLIAAVRSGKGFVGIHSATDTHCKLRIDGRDPYVAMSGGRFCGHGPSQFMTIKAVEPIEVPWLKKLNGEFTAHDEWYAMREFNPDMHVVYAMQTAQLFPHPENLKHYGRADFPLCWIRMEGKGRVAYTPQGHDDKFWWNKENVRRVGEFVLWSLGRFDMDTTPNIEKVCPGYAEKQ